MKKSLVVALIVLLVSGFMITVDALGSNAIIVSYSGNVSIESAELRGSVAPKLDMEIKQGDKINTGMGSFLEIAFKGNRENIVRVEQNSSVIVKLDKKEQLELIDGALLVQLKQLGKKETFTVRTPHAACGARGTGWEMRSGR